MISISIAFFSSSSVREPSRDEKMNPGSNSFAILKMLETFIINLNKHILENEQELIYLG